MHRSFCFKLISMHINLKQQVVPEKNQKVINKILKYIIIAKEKIKIKRIINNLVPEDLNETKRNKTKQENSLPSELDMLISELSVQQPI